LASRALQRRTMEGSIAWHEFADVSEKHFHHQGGSVHPVVDLNSDYNSSSFAAIKRDGICSGLSQCVIPAFAWKN
jgi:hypothetical protein